MKPIHHYHYMETKISSTLLNINDSESPEKNFSFVNSSDLQFKFKVKWGSKGTGNDQF